MPEPLVGHRTKIFLKFKEFFIIDTNAKTLIKKFFDITEELSKHKIIRSSKYLGDIGEYLAKDIYQIGLENNQRNMDYDGVGKYDNKKYQIKFNNSAGGTNQAIGIPDKYDYLVLMVTSDSFLYDKRYPNYFMCIYKFESEFLKSLKTKKIAKQVIQEYQPEFFIDFALNVIKNTKN